MFFLYIVSLLWLKVKNHDICKMTRLRFFLKKVVFYGKVSLSFVLLIIIYMQTVLLLVVAIAKNQNVSVSNKAVCKHDILKRHLLDLIMYIYERVFALPVGSFVYMYQDRSSILV